MIVVVIAAAVLVCCICSCCMFCLSGGGTAYFGLKGKETDADGVTKKAAVTAAVTAGVRGKPLASYPATCADAKIDPYFIWLKGNVTSWTDADRNTAIYIINVLFPESAGGIQGKSNSQVLAYLNKC